MAPLGFSKRTEVRAAGVTPFRAAAFGPVRTAGSPLAFARLRSLHRRRLQPGGSRAPERPNGFSKDGEIEAAGVLGGTLVLIPAVVAVRGSAPSGARLSAVAGFWPDRGGKLAPAGGFPPDIHGGGLARLLACGQPAPLPLPGEPVGAAWRAPVPWLVPNRGAETMARTPGMAASVPPGVAATATAAGAPLAAPARVRSRLWQPEPAGQLDAEIWTRTGQPVVRPEPMHLVQPPRRRVMPWAWAGKKWYGLPLRSRRTICAAPVALFALFFIREQSGPDPVARMKSSISERALIDLEDDFRSGLSRWEGVPNWARGWGYDAAGFLRPGNTLGLLSESRHLDGYTLEFLAQIERGALSWVVRAADLKNYYVFRIAVSRPGPLPAMAIQNYLVTKGVAGPRRQLPLPLQVRNDTLYRVKMDVRGDTFTTSVNGQVVDHWTDARLPSGGIGFFSDRGEAALLRWVRVTRNDDILGRLCSQLFSGNRR
jgi:hypothetical protein